MILGVKSVALSGRNISVDQIDLWGEQRAPAALVSCLNVHQNDSFF